MNDHIHYRLVDLFPCLGVVATLLLNSSMVQDEGCGVCEIFDSI